MNEKEVTRATTLFKTLSDPNRFRIFAELMAGDSCNCELKENLDLAPNLLSHHLKVLESAGLVNSRRDIVDGRWIYYAVKRDEISHWRQWLATFFNPDRIQSRPVCGPEGQLVPVSGIAPVTES